MAKWDYLLESDARLRKAYKAWVATGGLVRGKAPNEWEVGEPHPEFSRMHAELQRYALAETKMAMRRLNRSFAAIPGNAVNKIVFARKTPLEGDWLYGLVDGTGIALAHSRPDLWQGKWWAHLVELKDDGTLPQRGDYQGLSIFLNFRGDGSKESFTTYFGTGSRRRNAFRPAMGPFYHIGWQARLGPYIKRALPSYENKWSTGKGFTHGTPIH